MHRDCTGGLHLGTFGACALMPTQPYGDRNFSQRALAVGVTNAVDRDGAVRAHLIERGRPALRFGTSVKGRRCDRGRERRQRGGVGGRAGATGWVHAILQRFREYPESPRALGVALGFSGRVCVCVGASSAP